MDESETGVEKQKAEKKGCGTEVCAAALNILKGGKTGGEQVPLPVAEYLVSATKILPKENGFSGRNTVC